MGRREKVSRAAYGRPAPQPGLSHRLHTQLSVLYSPKPTLPQGCENVDQVPRDPHPKPSHLHRSWVNFLGHILAEFHPQHCRLTDSLGLWRPQEIRAAWVSRTQTGLHGIRWAVPLRCAEGLSPGPILTLDPFPPLTPNSQGRCTH